MFFLIIFSYLFIYLKQLTFWHAVLSSLLQEIKINSIFKYRRTLNFTKHYSISNILSNKHTLISKGFLQKIICHKWWKCNRVRKSHVLYYIFSFSLIEMQLHVSHFVFQIRKLYKNVAKYLSTLFYYIQVSLNLYSMPRIYFLTEIEFIVIDNKWELVF